MRANTSAQVSWQQKSVTSRLNLALLSPPPPLLRPNPRPALPVSILVLPACISAPAAGGCGLAVLRFRRRLLVARLRLRRLAFGSGNAILGGVAAGGVSTAFGSGGATRSTVRPPMVFSATGLRARPSREGDGEHLRAEAPSPPSPT